MLVFNSENMAHQTFPFCKTIMDHIFENIIASQLLKLYKTCKFFYNKFRLNIIEDFELCNFKENERIFGNSLAIWHENPAWQKLNNLWISKSFAYYEATKELEYDKFVRMTYSKLGLLFDDFRVKEFEFLVQPSTLRQFILKGSIFYPETKTCLSIAEIMDRVPHVTKIDISREFSFYSFPTLDMPKLLSSNRQSKLSTFKVYYLSSEIPDPLLVVEFFKKHAIPDIDYFFDFYIHDPNYNKENIKNFYKIIDAEIQAWKRPFQFPCTISSFINLTGKNVFITGALSGVGKAAAILFRKLGASVIVVAENDFHLFDLQEECQNIKNDGFLQAIPEMRYADDKICFKFGKKLDILVNIADNIGCDIIPPVGKEASCLLDKYIILKNNFEEIKFYLANARQYLIDSKGCFINVTNEKFNVKPEYANAIVDYEEKIANIEAELAASGVRINTVDPGTSSRAFSRSTGMSDFKYKKYLDQVDKFYAFIIVSHALDSTSLTSDETSLIDALNFD